MAIVMASPCLHHTDSSKNSVFLRAFVVLTQYFVGSILRPLDIWQCEFFSTCGEAHTPFIIVNLNNFQHYS